MFPFVVIASGEAARQSRKIIMKKITAAVLTLVLFSSLASAQSATYVPPDTKGNGYVAGRVGIDASFFRGETLTGYLISAEYMYPMNKYFHIGGGIEGVGSGKIFAAPIYASFLFKPQDIFNIADLLGALAGVYAKLNIGYNMGIYAQDSDLNQGGAYISITFGADFNTDFFVELAIGRYEGQFKFDNIKGKDVLTTAGINAGYRFYL